MNTENGAVEPRKVFKVDLTEPGSAEVFFADGSKHYMSLSAYRERVADGEFNVDDAEFITNATTILPKAVEGTTTIISDIPLTTHDLPVSQELPVSVDVFHTAEFFRSVKVYVILSWLSMFVIALLAVILK